MHTRSRKFNTKDTYPEQALDIDLCQALIAGNTTYLCGQCPQDLDTSVSVAIGDPEGQAEQVMRNVEQLLRACGASCQSTRRSAAGQDAWGQRSGLISGPG